MKNFKKLTAAVAATLMAATMVAPMAFAAEGDATADNTTTGNKPATIAETDGEQQEDGNDGDGDNKPTEGPQTTTQIINLTLPEGLPDGAKMAEVIAYKVFDVEYDNEAITVKGWGKDVDEAGILAALKLPADTSAEEVANKLTSTGLGAIKAEDFAKFVMNNIKTNAGVKGTINNGGTVSFENLSNGYYATSCTVQIGDDEDYNAKSLGMLAILEGEATNVGEAGVAKIGLPEVQKKVKENQKENLPTEDGKTVLANYETDEDYNDIADWNIGDSVPFKLYGTMPDNLDMYEKYFYQFNDNLGVEFTRVAKSDAYTVKIDGTTIPETSEVDEETVNNYNVTFGQQGENKIIVTFDDIKAAAARVGVKLTSKSVVTVEYEAVLNTNAVVGKPGQDNEVYLTYSNNPNKYGEGERGKTPEDKVRVYTYGFTFEKYFTTGNSSKVTAEELATWKSGGSEAIEFKLTKGEDGKEPIYVKPAGENEEGWNYVLATKDEEGATTVINLFAIEGNNERLSVKIKGLDEGTYYLTETKAPKGYNAVENVPVVITADTGNTQDWLMTEDTLTEFKYKVDKEVTQTGADITGIAMGEIENKKGTTLPTTGGVGTRLFYFFGGAMVSIAGVSLITKKRMGKNQIL